MSAEELQQKISQLNQCYQNGDTVNFQRLYIQVQRLVWCDRVAGGLVYRKATPYEQGYRVWTECI